MYAIHYSNTTATAYTLSFHIPTQKFKTRHIEFYVSHIHIQSFRWKKGSCLALTCPVPCCVSLLVRAEHKLVGCYELSCCWDWKGASSVATLPGLYRAICIHAYICLLALTRAKSLLILLLLFYLCCVARARWNRTIVMYALYCNKAACT